MSKARDRLNEIVANPDFRAAFERRFWAKVDKRGPDECWDWTGKSKHPFGYGRLTAGRGFDLKAHQVSFALSRGHIGDHIHVCHKCDRPACCNPMHLFAGTHQINCADMRAKARQSEPPTHFGEVHHKTKFDTETALRISADGRAARIVSAEYGISEKTVYRLRHKTTWKELWA